MSVNGECFCGQVKYQIDGQLRDARSCHCSRCRKAFNAQFSAMAMVNPSEFKWLSGKELLTSYVGQHGYGIQFCQTCGSTLSVVYNGDVVGITLGCVNGDPGVEIGMHIYVGSKATWDIIPEGVPQFQEGPENA